MKYEFVKSNIFEFILLFVISALVYLPNLHQLGYYKDDWYLMYSAHTQGPEIFRDVFSIDRPARGELLLILYRAFGDNPLYYNLSAYLFRYLSAIGFLWILRTIFPTKRMVTLTATILFMIYPGYLSQVNAIDFQAHVVSLTLAVFSVALSLNSIFIKNRLARYSAMVLSVLLGWLYLGLVEYSIGLEIFRLCCFFVILSHNSNDSFLHKVIQTLKKISFYFTIPTGFLFWRIFIFQNERRSTDLASQLGVLFDAPILTGLRWGVYIVQDMLNVIVFAWVVPTYQIAFQLRLRDALISLAISVFVLLLIYFSYNKRLFISDDSGDTTWRMQLFWIGIITVLANILPVIVTNRHVDFSEFSRYALPGSIGAILVLIAILQYLDSPYIRMGITYLCIIVAVFTHYANAAQAAVLTASANEFWWQVSWRAPQIKEGTTLVVHSAEFGIPESYVVWGPANIIYYPEKHMERPVQLTLSATILSDESITKITTKNGKEDINIGRSWVFSQNYKNVLVISKPSELSCTKIIDGKSLERSISENYGISLIAPYSQIENVLTDQAPHIPPATIFGQEPEHGWCYYFQKADLARQSGNWDVVSLLGDEALKMGLHPDDQIEWLPFLQAYAILGKREMVEKLSTRINTEKYYKYQACQIMMSMDKTGYPISPEMSDLADKLFCSNK